MLRNQMIRIWCMALVAMGSLPMVAHAQNISGRSAGQAFADLGDQTGNLADFVSIVAFVLGVGMAIAGFMKFKQNAQNPNDPSAKLSTAFVLLLVGAGLVAIPATLGSGILTIFGSGAGVTDADDGFRALR